MRYRHSFPATDLLAIVTTFVVFQKKQKKVLSLDYFYQKKFFKIGQDFFFDYNLYVPNFIFNIQMSVYSKAIEEFQALNSQLKKEKLLSLLRKFETLDEIFVKLINSVSSKNYTDRILVGIYKVLVSSLEKIEQMDLQKGLDELQSLFLVLEKIQQAEALDRQQEGDPELWLEQILSTNF
ncbi:MAG TPA: hypothetical protein PKX34_02630 [Candidatus Absconditabacterales bacterium]|nr:hypothetical protein [Candidatus Absconditabacterales bacterium]